MLKAWRGTAVGLEVGKTLVMEEGMRPPGCKRERRAHVENNTQAKQCGHSQPEFTQLSKSVNAFSRVQIQLIAAAACPDPETN